MFNREELPKFQEVAAKFPPTFGLRAFPGLTFRISEANSYFTEFGGKGTLMLYLQRQYSREEYLRVYDKEPASPESLWVDFAKGTETELLRNVVKL